ncbi:DNA polymerase IV [Halopelagius longus]|uniref:DNA polymerase IV n=1 Tax=Halopelagius longus TaxID=1236180 RepID=A0A1H1B6Q6_9EURY|nr:DNA polymerase IV [Halopelagius longus]RDI70668.1 DNA polymerase IV [Halopelagius longus]SDQ47617.1 DNA polymerase IV (DinB-like DNA polymerase) [Halopelagius longus]
MAGETLPGVDDGGESEAPRIVLHVDMDCFYASCERLREPELRGEPLVVGMGYESGETFGAVATASYEAREYGVESAQPISQALDRLPRVETAEDPAEAGYYRPVDIDYYKSVAAEVKEILHECADVVREVSIDEAYLDVTDRTSWETTPDGDRTLAEGFARHVKQRIGREVGVPASVGVAPNMSAAKVASDHDKPNGLVVVEPGEVRSFLAPLSVEEVHGVGPVTARKLAEMGIETAGELAAADADEIASTFGSRGRELRSRARGDDDREVTPAGRPKSLSRESAFADATDDAEKKRDVVSALAADVSERARSRGAMYRTIGIKVVLPPYDVNTRERSLSGPVDEPELVEDVALDLLSEFDDEAARKVGVRVSNLSFTDADQSSLDGWESAKSESESVTGDEREAEADAATPKSDGGTATRDAEESAASPTLTDFDAEAGSNGEGGSDAEAEFGPETDSEDAEDADGQASLGQFE